MAPVVLVGDAASFGGPPLGLLAVRTGTRWGLPGPASRGRARPRGTPRPWVPLVLAAAEAWQQTEAAASSRGHGAPARWSTASGAAAAAVPDIEVVGDPDDRLPHVVTFSVLYVDGEALLEELARRGFAVASGSACTSSTLGPATCSPRWACSPTATCG